MQIIVKRFCLSHNGKIYTAGDVVEIEDTKMARRLVARSGGALEIYHGDEIEDDDNADNDDDDDGDAGDGGASDNVSDSDSDDGADGIPAFDPAAAVQTDNTPPKGKGKGKKK